MRRLRAHLSYATVMSPLAVFTVLAAAQRLEPRHRLLPGRLQRDVTNCAFVGDLGDSDFGVALARRRASRLRGGVLLISSAT
jgi:hypothetical protein